MPRSRRILACSLAGALLAVLAAAPLPPAAAAPALDPAWVVGAYPAPPKGPGPGRIVAWRVGSDIHRSVSYAPAHSRSGNSFYIAHDARTGDLYVPSQVGRVYVIAGHGLRSRGWFASIGGARVARVSPDGKLLLVLSGKRTAAYTLPGERHRFTIGQGGNAVVFGPRGRHAFIGGNMRRDLLEIDTANGRIVRRFAIGHSGDLAWVDGKVFSVDMRNGVLSVLDPSTGAISRIRTPEVDPHFSYRHIPQASAGFMQVAVDPANHRLYVAGFSGHILRFGTGHPRYLGEVAVRAAPAGHPNHLSGLALIDHGREALVTVENFKEAVVVRLSDGKILRRLPGVASNRWVGVGRI